MNSEQAVNGGAGRRGEPARGLLDLTLERRGDGRTGIVARKQRFPLRMTVPMYLDPAAPDLPFIYVQNPTGGVFPDDELNVSLDVGRHARVHLTTQSATKVYAGPGAEAHQLTTVRLADGAYAELIPDTLIPHAGARVTQEVAVELGEDAAFVACELLAPGRHLERERFAFSRVRLMTSVRDHRGDELCVDVVELEPQRRSPARRGVLGQHAYLGTLLAVAPGIDAMEVAEALDGLLALDESVVAGAAVLPRASGVGVRVLADRPAVARRALDSAWAHVRRELLGVPPPRRRK